MATSLSVQDDIIHVKFISDDDVMAHIVHINDKRKKVTEDSLSKRQSNISDVTAWYEGSTTDHCSEENILPVRYKPKVLLDDIGKSLVGSDVFSFKKSRPRTPQTQATLLHEKAVLSAENARRRVRESRTSVPSSKCKTLKNSTSNNSRRSTRCRISIKECLAESSDGDSFISSSNESETEEPPKGAAKQVSRLVDLSDNNASPKNPITSSSSESETEEPIKQHTKRVVSRLAESSDRNGSFKRCSKTVKLVRNENVSQPLLKQAVGTDSMSVTKKRRSDNPSSESSMTSSSSESETEEPVKRRTKRVVSRLAESSDDNESVKRNATILPCKSETGKSVRNKNVSQPLLKPAVGTGSMSVTKRSERIAIKQTQANSADAYFEAHDSVAQTSDHTLARLENPKLDHSSLISLLKNIPLSHAKEIKKLNQSYKDKFRKWVFQLNENFNLLLYGIGSKRQLILQFQETIEEAEGLVINGFFPNITIKSVLSYIIEEVLQTTNQGQDQLEFIKEALEEDPKDIYIFFHNIDGTVLRSEKAQNLLSQLALIKGIHIVASIDHINAPLIWDQTRLSRFNWLWYNVTTFEPYTNETAFENSLLMQPSSELVLSSLIHVFRSLNPKAKGIFLLLAKNQLANAENTNYTGMSYQECYHKCREAFLVNSDLTMKAQLTEFKDHKLMKSKKGSDGLDYLTIPLEATTLAEFVTEHSKE